MIAGELLARITALLIGDGAPDNETTSYLKQLPIA